MAMLRAEACRIWRETVAEEGKVSSPPKRHGKPKEGRKRKDDGAKIVVRMTAEERSRLAVAAGDKSLSDYVRQRLFATDDGRTQAGDRTRDVLRKVAALHLLARKIDRMIDVGIEEDILLDLIVEIRMAIEGCVASVPDTNEDPAE